MSEDGGLWLEARGLRVARQERTLCGPLDLELGPGQAAHLQGPNGSGKTTLMRTLAGLRPPAAGKVWRHVALWFVGHAGALSDELGALDNLRGLLAMHGETRPAQAEQLLPWLAAEGLPRHRPVRELSAGQRRRLALAPLTLAPRPLWLLDEPFDALDSTACASLAKAASAHLRRGGALLLSSHQALPAGFPNCTPWVLAPVAAEAL